MHEVKVQDRGATLVLAKRTAVQPSEMSNVLPAALVEVYGHIGRHGGDPDGPPFVIYPEVPAPGRPFAMEICAPVRIAIDAPAGWELEELPAGLFASLVHVGPYDTVSGSYGDLAGWIGSHGYAIAGPPREVYLSPPETPPDKIRTIIEFPVVLAVAPVPVR